MQWFLKRLNLGELSVYWYENNKISLLSVHLNKWLNPHVAPRPDCKDIPLLFTFYYTKETQISVYSNFYSLFQIKRTFNSKLFVAPLGEGAKNSHSRLCNSSIYIINNVNFWPPSPRGATKKF